MIREPPHRPLTAVGQRSVSAIPHPDQVLHHPCPDPTDDPTDPCLRGVRLLLDDNPAAAACVIRHAIEADPDRALAAAALAVALAELAGSDGDAEAAAAVTEAGRRLRGRPRRERQQVAIIELALGGRLARASALAREHLAEFPDDRIVLHVVARRSDDLDDLLPPP
jgi:hypothetical protein